MRMRKLIIAGCVVAFTAGVAVSQAKALRRIMPVQQPGANGMVNLPYQVQDGQGTTWMIYNSGWLQQQGNMPMYSQGAMLNINQNQPNQNAQQARLDAKTGEVVFENMVCQNTTVTRRIKIEKEAGYARYIDIIKNTQNAEQTVNLMLQTNTNYGVSSATVMNDPKRKTNNIAWVAQTSGNRTVVEMYSGKGSKNAFTLAYQQGNNQVSASMSLTIPAGKEVAVMHLHSSATDPATAQKWVETMKETQLMKDIPPAIRRLICNFSGGQSFIGEYEILRGEAFDVVELRSGDQYRGTIKEPTFKLTTFYGPVELPVEKVIGLINVGEFRPRQLVVTSEGEIFGGRLEKDTIAIELSSGQVTQVPLSQVSRLGYRKRAGEPEEWTFDKPLVLMRTGDRMGVEMPAGEIEVATRYGALKLKPSAVSAISFANEEHGIHEIFLSDGSKFAGLATADKFDMKLSAGGRGAPVSFPSSSVARIQLAPRAEDPDDTTPTLNLSNEDVLVGTLAGKLKLETAFDTLVIDATQIKSLKHAKGSVQDVQVTLWDDTTVSGQLAETELACSLRCGVTMRVPVALVDEYNQPTPQPNEAMIKRIKDAVTELSADDWKARDRAESSLVNIGPMAAGTLKQLRTEQKPDVQQRIDSVLKQLETKAKEKPTSPSPVAPVPIEQLERGQLNLQPQGAAVAVPAQQQVEIRGEVILNKDQ